MNTKVLSIILVAILVLNLALFAFRQINELVFWITIIIIGLVAYKVLPKLKK